jgi:putative oxidoreductase
MKNLLCCSCGDKYRDEAILILRVVTGLLFVYHGYVKIFVMGMMGTAGFFSKVGIPAPEAMAYLVAYGELLGGIALILGVLTHWVAKLNILIMLGAIYFVHLANGYDGSKGGYEYQLLILAVSIFFAAYGPGKYNLEKCIKRNCNTTTDTQAAA